MKKINNIKNALSDNSGLSLIELIISAALITIIGAGFCAASASASIATQKNQKAVKERTTIVSYIDNKALTPIITAEESTKYFSKHGKELKVNPGQTEAEIQSDMDNHVDYLPNFYNVWMSDTGGGVMANTKMKCAVCKPVDHTLTSEDGQPVDRAYFGFEIPNDATTGS